MGACASRSDDDGVDAASHLEAYPAGPGGAATVKAELERPATFGCAFGRKRRGVPERTPASPASVEARGAASPVAEAAARVPRTPELRSAASRAPIPRTASGGRGGRGPGGGGGRGLGHAEGDAAPDARAGFGFDDPETARAFLGRTKKNAKPREDGLDDADADAAFGRDLLALSASRVRKWDEREADTDAWRTYRELMEEARRDARAREEALAAEASIDAFVKHFPQRREGGDAGDAGAGATSANSSTSAASLGSREPEASPPAVISALARLAADATARADANWARCDAVRAMLAEDVVYRTIEGARVRGREAAVEAMCASVEKVARRFKLRTSETRAGGKAVPERASRVKVKSEGPTLHADAKGREIWIVHYAFDLLLLKIRVKETFRVDRKTGVIKEFSRARA